MSTEKTYITQLGKLECHVIVTKKSSSVVESFLSLQRNDHASNTSKSTTIPIDNASRINLENFFGD